MTTDEALDYADIRRQMNVTSHGSIDDALKQLADEVRRLRSEQAGFPHLSDMRLAMIETANENERLKIEKARLWESLIRLNRAVPMTGSQAKDGMMMFFTSAQWDELTAASEQVKTLWEKIG